MKAKRIGIGLAVAAFWVALWWGVAALVDQTLLIPTPWQVLTVLWQVIRTALFWKTVAISLLRMLGGFAAAVAAGVLMAVLTARSSLLRALFSPLLHVVRAAPVASFIILALVWIVTDAVPTFISFLMVFPIVWANVETGLQRISPELKEVASVYRLSRRRVLTVLVIPSVAPYFHAACTSGLGFAWKSAVAAEVICRPELSIGRQLQAAKLSLETPEVFAWTTVVVLLSMLLEWLLKRSNRLYNQAKHRTLPSESQGGGAQ